jgi:hypothetical protein
VISCNYLQDLANSAATHEENHRLTKTIGSFSICFEKEEGIFSKKEGNYLKKSF